MSEPASRVPPHSIEAERAALGSVFISPQALDELADLSTNDFFMPAHREVLEAMRIVAGRGQPVDVLSVADELKALGVLARLDGGAAYLNDLANATPTAENVRYYAGAVASKAIRRRVIAACADISSSAYGDAIQTDELVADARAMIAGIDIADEDGPTLLGDDLGAVVDSIEHRAQKPDDYFVPTGLRSFDEKYTGLRGGNLIVVAGRPGKGKSAWAMDILLHAAFSGIPVLLFSFEMTKAELIERAITKCSRVDGRRVVSGQLNGPEWVRVTAAASRLAPLPFWLMDSNLTAPRICSISRRWLARQRRAQPDGKDRRLAVVGVDYVGLVKSSGDEYSREREVAVISALLKQLAGELNVPVIEISQINRESEKTGREPRISDLRESGAIEQDANMIMFPHWNDPEPGADVSEGIEAKIVIAKNRGGPTGFVWCKWLPQFVTFQDVDSDGPQQEALI